MGESLILKNLSVRSKLSGKMIFSSFHIRFHGDAFRGIAEVLRRI